MQAPAVVALIEECADTKKMILSDMGVPDENKLVDVFLSYYKPKKGKETNALFVTFTNVELQIYRDESNFYVADLESLVAIPLSSFTGIYKVNKRVTFDGWNKEEPTNSPKYKPYNIMRCSVGLTIKPYYSIHFNIDGDEYEILIPNYELDNFIEVLPSSIEIVK